MNIIPDDVLATGLEKYQALLDEAQAFTLDAKGLIAGIEQQAIAMVSSKVPAEYGLTVNYKVDSNFVFFGSHRFTLTAENILPLQLVVTIGQGLNISTELSVGGVVFTELLPAIGLSRNLFLARQAEIKAQANQEFVTLEQ